MRVVDDHVVDLKGGYGHERIEPRVFGPVVGSDDADSLNGEVSACGGPQCHVRLSRVDGRREDPQARCAEIPAVLSWAKVADGLVQPRPGRGEIHKRHGFWDARASQKSKLTEAVDDRT